LPGSVCAGAWNNEIVGPILQEVQTGNLQTCAFSAIGVALLLLFISGPSPSSWAGR
jgi:hypothetical protein